MSFFSNLANLFKSNRADIRKVVSVYPPAAMAIKVNDLVFKSKSGDEDAKARLSALKELAANGDPKAQQALAMARDINTATNKKSGSYYDLGVSVGHDSYDFVGVGAVRGGYSYNYTTNSWYRTPAGQKDIPGPDGMAGTPMATRDQRTNAVNRFTHGTVTDSLIKRGSAEAKKLNAKNKFLDYGCFRTHKADHLKYGNLVGPIRPGESMEDYWARNRAAADKYRTNIQANAALAAEARIRNTEVSTFDPSTAQDHVQTAWDLGVSDKVPPALQEQFGVDADGNPLPGFDPYGQGQGGFDPSYGYGGYGGGMPLYGDADPFYGQYAGNPYAPYGFGGGWGDCEIITNPANQVYDPATDRFYSACVRQSYDPDTDSFAPVQEYNPYSEYGCDPFGSYNISGWALNVPYRSTSQHVTQAGKSPGIALAARELYNRGIGQPATTKASVVRQGLSNFFAR